VRQPPPRHWDDRYHLIIPVATTLDDPLVWAVEACTITWLDRRGVRMLKRCADCQVREDAGK
jgi:hypothetical protein